MIKELKTKLIEDLESGGFYADVLSAIFPKTKEEAEELENQANSDKATIFVCFAGRDWGQPNTTRVRGAYSPNLTFALIIYSLHIDTEETHDIETLTDEIAKLLFQKGWKLMEDIPTAVPNQKGLYENTFYVSKTEIFQGV